MTWGDVKYQVKYVNFRKSKLWDVNYDKFCVIIFIIMILKYDNWYLSQKNKCILNMNMTNEYAFPQSDLLYTNKNLWGCVVLQIKSLPDYCDYVLSK